jgi:hypothetical protein
MKLSKTSLALLVLQLALVSTVGAKYVYQRWNAPRVWTRVAADDPLPVMHWRYLRLRMTVDGCQSTLPLASEANFPRNVDGTPRGKDFSVVAPKYIEFPARLKVMNNKLEAIRIPESESRLLGVPVRATPGMPCSAFLIDEPVNFYIANDASRLLPIKTGQELWIEVTVPSQGPPRPLQLALKQDGAWKPLAFQ